MEIEIPSPSVFLQRSPLIAATISPPPVKSTKARNPSNTKLPSKPKQVQTITQNGVVKPKQSKSRNGCMTCKKKRLKCDETKPSCEQCRRRNVECEGYKKDFKWRTFEEIAQNSRTAKAKKAEGNVDDSVDQPKPSQARSETIADANKTTKSTLPVGLHDAFTSAASALKATPPPAGEKTKNTPTRRKTPPEFAPLPILDPALSPSQFELPSPTIPPLDDVHTHDIHTHSKDAGPLPRVDELVSSANHEHLDSSEMRLSMSPNFLLQDSFDHDVNDNFSLEPGQDDDAHGNVVHGADISDLTEATQAHWHLRSISSSANSSMGNTPPSRASNFDMSSPEHLMHLYSFRTCGILSVKDGPNENPWRTMIWPLAKNCEALYHALSSMTALHAASSVPEMRFVGMAHMTKAISKLSTQIGHMRLDEALGTSLVLAIGESWDERISTGIQHLHGARTLVNTALAHCHSPSRFASLSQAETMRLRFLCNTFIYLDVIARLTSLEQPSQNPDTEDVLHTFNDFSGNSMLEVDPLMGCAGELFPRMGQAAQLIQEARHKQNNSLAIVTKANEIREDLLSWQPPPVQMVERPEDPTSDVTHSVQTAEAYRIATLLYLHQAVPEMVMEKSAHSLAKTILTLLAGVPLSSRTMIIQIFPLLVGSCEMTSDEDREWVTSRWVSMMQRRDVVNVKSCWELVQDVWARRDVFEAARPQRRPKNDFQMPNQVANFPNSRAKRFGQLGDGIGDDDIFDMDDAPRHLFGNGAMLLKRGQTFNVFESSAMNLMPRISRRSTELAMNKIEPEYSIRGSLHWLSAMTERGWELFLG